MTIEKTHPLIELDGILESNNYRFVDFGNYEHDDIIPFTFEINYCCNKIGVILRNIDNNFAYNYQYFEEEIPAFVYIDELRIFINHYKRLKNMNYLDNDDLLFPQILTTLEVKITNN
jgi:hypothetical protein